MAKELKKDFFSRNAKVVARELLGKSLARKINGKFYKTRIVETEAYFDEKDPASKASRGNGDLKKTMKMPAGTILVYGVHNNWLVNFVTGRKGKAEAVLIRAVEPLNFNGNGKGPGLLTRLLKINKKHHKENLFNSSEIWVEEGNGTKIIEIVEKYRIGVSKDIPEKMRFYIKDNKHVSRK